MQKLFPFGCMESLACRLLQTFHRTDHVSIYTNRKWNYNSNRRAVASLLPPIVSCYTYSMHFHQNVFSLWSSNTPATFFIPIIPMFSQCIGMYIQVQHLHMYVYYTYNTIIRMDVCIYVCNYRCTYVVLLIHNVISINCLLSIILYILPQHFGVYIPI